MDTLFIAHCPPYPPRFAERSLIYYLGREFHRRRRLVDLICFYEEPEQLADVPRYAHFFREVKLISAGEREKINFKRRLKKNHFPKAKDESWSEEMWHTVEFFLNTRPYRMAYLFGDIYIYEYSALLTHYPTILAPVNAPLNALPPQIAAAQTRREKQILTERMHALKNYESWIYRPFQRLVVSTEQDTKTITKVSPNSHVRAIPLGVDLDYFVPTGYPPRTPALLFMGNFAYPHDLEAALRLCKQIYPQVKRSIPALELYIVGDNPPRELQKFASDTVHITGHVLDLRPFFELASVYVSPLVQQVGIHIPILQALAMRTPVVATPKSLEGLKLHHEQHLLIGETLDELVRNIHLLLQNQALYQRLQQDGQNIVYNQYSWQRIADYYESLEDELLRV